MNFLVKLLSLIAVPILDWVYSKTLGWYKDWAFERARKEELEAKIKEIELKAKAVTAQTVAAQTKEERERAAEKNIDSL